MPLQKFFASQKKQIEMFLADPHRTMLRLAVDPEAEAMVVKLLSAVDGDPRNADVFIGCDHTFETARPFYERTLSRISEEYEKVRPELEKKGIQCSVSPKLACPNGGIESAFAREAVRFREAISKFADNLVFVFAVPHIAHRMAYCASLKSLLGELPKSAVRIIALDRRSDPLLADLAKERDDISTYEFNLSPEVIEQGVKDKLADPSCPQLMRMRCLTMLAGFAMARKEFDVAVKLGNDVLENFGKEKNGQEEAAAAFNLGNTYYRKEDYATARQYYERSFEVALSQKMHNLAEQCLINVGNTWYMDGDLTNALAYYEGAKRWSKAINNPFGVCQALDLIGLAKQGSGQKEAARLTWKEALDVYRTMPPELNQMAKMGETQILARLETLHDRSVSSTKQRAAHVTDH
jgi:hypothetical protein